MTTDETMLINEVEFLRAKMTEYKNLATELRDRLQECVIFGTSDEGERLLSKIQAEGWLR